MIETFKFINLKTYSRDQADSDIDKRKYQKTMDNLYETLNRLNPGGFTSARIKHERRMRDENIKNIIQHIKNTHLIVGYFEIISDTDKKNVKKISIVLPKNYDGSTGCSETTLFFLKDTLKKAYYLYNEIISLYKFEEPFLAWDEKISFGDSQVKVDMNSIDEISKLGKISKMIDIAIDKINEMKL